MDNNFSSCYDCCWSTDKCKNKDSDKYDFFIADIKICSLTGSVDNSLGCSFKQLKDDDL